MVVCRRLREDSRRLRKIMHLGLYANVPVCIIFQDECRTNIFADDSVYREKLPRLRDYRDTYSKRVFM